MFTKKDLIQQKKKGLILTKRQLTNVLSLSENYVLGVAVGDDGGCFFDGLAQTLNALRRTTQYTEKALREMCHAYYKVHKAEVDNWNKQAYKGINKGNNYYFVKYTKKN